MRRYRVLVGVAAVLGTGALAATAAAYGGSVPAARAAVPAAGSWGRAIAVPGLAALNTGGLAAVNSVSCGSAGNCVAGGGYADASGLQGFVAVERDGIWGKAIEVPGLAAMNTGEDAQVDSVSCGAAGSCAASGFYTDHGGGYQGFVAVERNGLWGSDVQVPGLAALNTGGDAEVFSVSCTSAGNCVAGGKYRDGRSHLHGFVAVERNGRWAKAIEVPGLGALQGGGDATVFSVSCASAGNCAAGGSYHRNHHHQGFVASERNGVWGNAIEVPGLATLNSGGQAIVNAVSCASAGNCAAGGDYTHRGGKGFLAIERRGRWGKAIEVPGLAGLNSQVDSVSCGSAGNCAAGGYPGFVADARHGRWDRAIQVPGLKALSTRGLAGVNSVSCASAGNCAAVGDYQNRTGGQGFVAVQRNGRWGRAIEVPGLAALNTGGGANLASVSCPTAGTCTAGGSYLQGRDDYQGFVVSQTG